MYHCFALQLETFNSRWVKVLVIPLQWLRRYKDMLRKMPQLSHLQWWIRSVKAAVCFCKLFLMSFLKTVGACWPAAEQTVTTSDCSKYCTIICDRRGQEKHTDIILSHLQMLAGIPKIPPRNVDACLLYMREVVKVRTSAICNSKSLQAKDNSSNNLWILILMYAMDGPLLHKRNTPPSLCIFTSNLVNWFSFGTFRCNTPQTLAATHYQRVKRKSAALRRGRVVNIGYKLPVTTNLRPIQLQWIWFVKCGGQG